MNTSWQSCCCSSPAGLTRHRPGERRPLSCARHRQNPYHGWQSRSMGGKASGVLSTPIVQTSQLLCRAAPEQKSLPPS
jgi:hypothetical protein